MAANGAPSPRKITFLSHSSADAELARTLCSCLESEGIGCWIAPRDVMPSRPWADEIVRGIESTDSLVLLASAQAIASDQVLSEVEQAHKRRKAIYTVLISKPKIGRELDYYISRLHWIELGSDSPEHLAHTLAGVLSGRRNWEQVAPGPSLRRTVLYRRDAFQGAALGTLLVLIVSGSFLLYWLQRSLDLDFRRLGHVTLAAQREQSPESGSLATKMQAQVWLQAKGVRFGDVKLVTAARLPDGHTEVVEHSNWSLPEQVGSVEFVEFAVPQTTNTLATCLIVPSPALNQPFRVTQLFAVRPVSTSTGDQMFVSPLAEAKVSKEDGLPCGS
jgi:hypothetical protein